MKSGGWKLNGWVIALITLLIFLSYRIWGHSTSDLFLSPSIAAPAFSLQDQTGKNFSSQELKGKVWVADFIFTRCQGQCPMLGQWFQILQNKWKSNPNFQLISFTVDPRHDSVSVLKKYARALQADPDQWHFLTGYPSQMDAVIQKGFHLSVGKDSQATVGFEFIHTTLLLLVDRKGMIRGMYDGQKAPEMEKLQKDIQYLLESRDRS